MTTCRFIRIIFSLFLTSALVGVVSITEAHARVGGGRSVGRPSGFNRRSAPPPAQQNRPANDQNYGNPQQPQNPPGAPARGNFMRGLAGGLAGGLLGSMLFSSLGQAAGFNGHGGIGFLEIILFAAIAFFAFRWFRNRQLVPAYTSARACAGYGSDVSPSGNDHLRQLPTDSSPSSVLGTAVIDKDQASDIFFKIQGAWTRRDLTSVKGLLGQEMYSTLDRDVADLKQQGHINRLENISVRNVEVVDSRTESGCDYAAVRFSANLLDYTVDERSNEVLKGNDTSPVVFEEVWSFAKMPVSSTWQLVGIEQS